MCKANSGVGNLPQSQSTLAGQQPRARQSSGWRFYISSVCSASFRVQHRNQWPSLEARNATFMKVQHHLDKPSQLRWLAHRTGPIFRVIRKRPLCLAASLIGHHTLKPYPSTLKVPNGPPRESIWQANPPNFAWEYAPWVC